MTFIGKSDHIVLVSNFHGGDKSDCSQDSVTAKSLWHELTLSYWILSTALLIGA